MKAHGRLLTCVCHACLIAGISGVAAIARRRCSGLGVIMAKAVVDPDELLRFVSSLKRFNETTRTELAAVNRQFRRLEETWQDEEQAQFADSFEQMVRIFARFLEASDQQVPLLTRKAELIREYLRAR